MFSLLRYSFPIQNSRSPPAMVTNVPASARRHAVRARLCSSARGPRPLTGARREFPARLASVWSAPSPVLGRPHLRRDGTWSVPALALGGPHLRARISGLRLRRLSPVGKKRSQGGRATMEKNGRGRDGCGAGGGEDMCGGGGALPRAGHVRLNSDAGMPQAPQRRMREGMAD